MLPRDFGWLLDLSNASCDETPLTPGFILTSGSIPDDYLGCACECQSCQQNQENGLGGNLRWNEVGWGKTNPGWAGKL